MNDDVTNRLIIDRIQFALPRLVDAAIREFTNSRGIERKVLVDQGITVTRVLELLDQNGIQYLNVMRRHVSERFHIDSANILDLDDLHEQLFQFLRDLGTSVLPRANPLAAFVAEAIEQSVGE